MERGACWRRTRETPCSALAKSPTWSWLLWLNSPSFLWVFRKCWTPASRSSDSGYYMEHWFGQNCKSGRIRFCCSHRTFYRNFSFKTSYLKKLFFPPQNLPSQYPLFSGLIYSSSMALAPNHWAGLSQAVLLPLDLAPYLTHTLVFTWSLSISHHS